MSRTVSKAEAWKTVYEAFQFINFTAYDYNTVKQSLIDYIKTYFPESFNDMIESSELIAILELFAYICELIAYRVDMNSHENFITTAQRKSSVLRLAKLISYSASRNIPARGLVKITSIQTSEKISDSNNIDLTNRKVIWNDINNPNWKEQFLLIINRVIQQEFGSVLPDERIQIDDVLFEQYSFNNSPIIQNGPSIFSYSVNISNLTLPMELVPVKFTNDNIEEKRPEINVPFTFLYGNDGLGDSSNSTGFFCFTKQGILNRLSNTFDGITPNQTFTIPAVDINETDIWVNQVNANTLAILDDNSVQSQRSGEWVQVDLTHAQNILFNTNALRNKFETETLENDSVKLIFGDGEFANIPLGTFHIWYRTSTNTDIVIPKSSILDQSVSFNYYDSNNNLQTCVFTFSAISSLQNNSASEDVEHIRRIAPSVYYTQDRMVNGKDYNTYMLQDPSILKLRSINRTFSGDSKYLAWHDPKEYYENVKIFGDDLVLFYDDKIPTDGGLQITKNNISVDQLIQVYVQPLLSSMDFFLVIGAYYEKLGYPVSSLRTQFRTSSDPYGYVEIPSIPTVGSIPYELDYLGTGYIDLYYSPVYDQWTVGSNPWDDLTTLNNYISLHPEFISKGVANSIWMIRIKKLDPSAPGVPTRWEIRYKTYRLIAQSESTKFWNTNDTSKVITYDSMTSNMDTLHILKANTNGSNTSILSDSYSLSITGLDLIEQYLPDGGNVDVHKLSVIAEDVNKDGIPDYVYFTEILDSEHSGLASTFSFVSDLTGGYITLPNLKHIPITYASTDIKIYSFNGSDWDLIPYSLSNDPNTWTPYQATTYFSKIHLNGTWTANSLLKIQMENYVYFYRASIIDRWIPVKETIDVLNAWTLEESTYNSLLSNPIQAEQYLFNREYKRCKGRNELNFAWFHAAKLYNLIDPSATNIIDTFIITKGYHLSMRNYLDGKTSIIPVEPTPVELRTSYASMMGNKMISDTLVLHSGKFKIVFGTHAAPELQATLKVIRPIQKQLSDNQVKLNIISAIKDFFDVNKWEFGESFYFSELSAYIHAALGSDIDSVVLVPTYANNQFGDLYQITCQDDEILIVDITPEQIEFVSSLNPINLRQ